MFTIITTQWRTERLYCEVETLWWLAVCCFFFSSRRRHTRSDRDWSSDVCSSDLGFTPDELAAAGLANRRGNDYFSRRLLFPLADARGRVVGLQARKLHDDDPLHAKYVNSPEGELFRKGDLLYGLDRARTAIAREDRALVVEGNPDVLALRQAGLEPVVASMGTALTEGQLKELGRLTKRLWLCFGGDAAGEAATLRGMELAVRAGFDVQVLTLPPGTDPADLADGFERRLTDTEHFLSYGV